MFPIRDTIPRRAFPIVVLSLIALNVLVFLWEIQLPEEWRKVVVMHLGLVPARYTLPEWAILNGLDPYNYFPFLSAQFLHGGFAHILGNLWTLWIFGPALEDRLGHLRFLVFYLLVGLVAMVVHVLMNTTSTVPAIGASGAIAGVMGGYAMRFPHARILFMVPVLFIPFFFEWPALLYGFFWFLIQFIQGTQQLFVLNLSGGVAWWAHVGGFLAGALLVRLFLAGGRREPHYFDDQGALGHQPDGRW